MPNEKTNTDEFNEVIAEFCCPTEEVDPKDNPIEELISESINANYGFVSTSIDTQKRNTWPIHIGKSGRISQRPAR
jgi:hypothetical protein